MQKTSLPIESITETEQSTDYRANGHVGNYTLCISHTDPISS
jgi:hypothetical protein